MIGLIVAVVIFAVVLIVALAAAAVSFFALVSSYFCTSGLPVSPFARHRQQFIGVESISESESALWVKRRFVNALEELFSAAMPITCSPAAKIQFSTWIDAITHW